MIKILPIRVELASHLSASLNTKVMMSFIIVFKDMIVINDLLEAGTMAIAIAFARPGKKIDDFDITEALNKIIDFDYARSGQNIIDFVIPPYGKKILDFALKASIKEAGNRAYNSSCYTQIIKLISYIILSRLDFAKHLLLTSLFN
jgi:hypothetical protein